MSKSPPQVRDFMSHLPVEVDTNDSVVRAADRMRAEGIRHLPVMDGTALFGAVSSRDLDVVLATCGSDAPITVGQICIRDPYTASPADAITAVSAEMLERRVGSAIIVDGGVVVGIYTVTDALRALVSAYN